MDLIGKAKFSFWTAQIENGCWSFCRIIARKQCSNEGLCCSSICQLLEIKHRAKSPIFLEKDTDFKSIVLLSPCN